MRFARQNLILVVALVALIRLETFSLAQPPSPVVYVAPIEGIIDLGLVRFIEGVLKQATDEGAAAIILEINTFGGRVDAAVLIRDTLLNARVRTVAFVNKAPSLLAPLNVSLEQILLLVLFLLLPLLNWIFQRAARPREGKHPQSRSMPELRHRAPVSARRSPEPPRTRERNHAREALPAPAVVQRRRLSGRSLFRTRAEMRRAIVLMTILQPCRAFDRRER
jgi:membrane-bound serine protease (ClpP class)